MAFKVPIYIFKYIAKCGDHVVMISATTHADLQMLQLNHPIPCMYNLSACLYMINVGLSFYSPLLLLIVMGTTKIYLCFCNYLITLVCEINCGFFLVPPPILS